jgi:hypothetical protein
MTQVTVPAAGDPIVTSWGQAVANHANHFIPLYMSADVSKTGNTYSDITGLSFAVVSGKEYLLDLNLWYDVAGTSTGLSVAYDLSNSATGTVRAIVQIFGNASATAATSEELSAEDTATGTSSTDATTIRLIRWTGLYRCTADGTFALRYKRNGTSTTVTIYAGSGGTVIEN